MLTSGRVQMTIFGVGVNFLIVRLLCRKLTFPSLCLTEMKSTGINEESSEYSYQVKLLHKLICLYVISNILRWEMGITTV